MSYEWFPILVALVLLMYDFARPHKEGEVTGPQAFTAFLILGLWIGFAVWFWTS